MPGVDHRLDDRDRHAAPRARAWTRSSTSSSKPALAGRHLQLRRAGNAVDRLVEREEHRSGSPCACPRRRATPSTMPAVVSDRPHHVLARVGPADEPQQDHRRSSSTTRAVAKRDRARAAGRHRHVVRDDRAPSTPSRACRSRMSAEDLGAGVRVEVARSARRPAGSAGRSTARARSRPAGVRRPRARPAGGRGAWPSCTSSSSSLARASTLRRGQPRRCSGSATFSRHESVGSRLKNWKMKPILSRRTRGQLVIRQTAQPPGRRWQISPALGRSRPPIRLSSVDLPEPDGPTMETSSPRPMARVTSSSADDAALAVELRGDVRQLDHGRSSRAVDSRR